MSFMGYLRDYEKQRRKKAFGIRTIVTNWLDNKWIGKGQSDRFAYLLHRTLELTSLKSDQELKILEIGGGDGKYLSYSSDAYHKTMIDIDNHYQEKLENKGVRFFHHDISSSSLDILNNNEFDLIAMNHVIEHISDIDVFMNEVNRVVKPSGYVYIRTPDIKKVGFSFYDDFTHVRPFSVSGLNHLMSCNGYEKVITQTNNNETILLDDLLGLDISKYLPYGKEIEAVYKRLEDKNS